MSSQLRAARHHNQTNTKTRSLRRFWFIAWMGMTLFSIAALLLIIWQSHRDQQQSQRELLRIGSSSVVEELATRSFTLRNQLDIWANDPHLRDRFKYADHNNLTVESQLLMQRLPTALAIHLFQVDITTSGPTLRPDDERRLSYAGIDLVRQVMKSKQVSLLEAHRVNQRDAHLAIAQPVLSDDKQQVIGVIHLALPFALLPKPSKQFTTTAQLVIQQTIGNESITIYPKTAGALPATAIHYTAPVPMTRLNVTAWIITPAWHSTPLAWTALALVLLLTLFYAILITTLASTQRRSLLKDVQHCIATLTALANNQVPPKHRLRNQEFAPLDAALVHLTEVYGNRVVSHQVAGHDAIPQFDADFAANFPDLPVTSVMLPHPTTIVNSPSTHPVSSPPSLIKTTSSPRLELLSGTIPARVFRPYDIRGLVDSEMTDEFMQLLGRAVATESLERGTSSMLVGRDYRPSSEYLTAGLITGLRSSGCNIIDLGQVPTPVLYFASQLAGNISGAVVTASHHPIEYNGLKLVFAGQSATPLTIAKLRQRLQHGQFTSGEGSYHEQSVLTDYLDEIEQNIQLARPLKIVVDGGFATPALVAPLLYRALGCDVIALRCDLNDAQAGISIPNPAKIDSLQLLADQVLANGADLGLGFGGDGDRLGVIDSNGQIITTDRVLMVLATHLLSQLPGSDVLFDVKCSSRLAEVIHHHGGRPVMWKSGHAFLKEKRQELNAPLAGEFNGHIMFADRWNGCDDAFYAGARLLEILAQDARSSSTVFADFPIGVATPELVLPVATGEEQEIMTMILEAKNRLSGVRVTTIDGLRVDSEQGWGLVRASNTEPALTFRFEADDQVTLNKLQDLFRRLLKVVAPKLTLPF